MVSRLLESQYRDSRRAYVEQAARIIPSMKPWPKRRTRRLPIPGVIDAPTDSEG